MDTRIPIKEQWLGYIGRTLNLPYPVWDRILRTWVRPPSNMPHQQFHCRHIAGRFQGNLASHIDWHIYFRGAYDRPGLDAIRNATRDRPRAVAWDVGANVGNHSLFLSQLFDSVYCFEPSPDLARSLRTNAAISDAKNISVMEYGLGDRNETAKYYAGMNGNEGQGSFANHGGREPSGEFPIRTGDSIFREIGDDHLDFIKIDVEGLEVEVLRGLRETLAEKRPLIFFEWISTSRAKISYAEFCELFPHAYSLYGLSKRRRAIDRLRSAPLLVSEPFDYHKNYSNVLAIPDSW